MPHRIIWSWYTGRWWVGCYIWYTEEGTGRGRSLPRPILAVPNVTACPSTSSVPITVLLYNVPLICSLKMPVKGLNYCSIKFTVTNRRSRSTSGLNDQNDRAAAPTRSDSRLSRRRRYPARPTPVSTQSAVRQAQTSVVAELMKAKTSRDNVGGCTNEVDDVVVFLPAAVAAVTAAEALSSIPPRRTTRRSVDSSGKI